MKRFEVLVAILLAFAVPLGSRADGHLVDRTPAFADLWAKLDAARSYREDFVDPDNPLNRGLGFDEMRERYEATDIPGLGGQTPRDAFVELVGAAGFGGRLASGSPAERREAIQGYREALGERIAGEVLLANKTLLQGLRSRFPIESVDPPATDQLSLLEDSVETFSAALSYAGDAARENAEILRAAGVVNPDFPWFVENTPAESGEQGEVVEAEFFRLTNLLSRYGTARNALAKRKFFFGNDDPASRADAAAEFKQSAQAVYLGSALLAASQTEDQFRDNLGADLDRQITIAEQFFDDIRNGFNPLTLQGDFVPAQSTNGLLDLLEFQTQSAICSEIDARNAARAYDEDRTALAQELEKQTLFYVDQVDILLGLVPPFPRPGDSTCDPPDQLFCHLDDPEERDLILKLADDRQCPGSPPFEPGDCEAVDYLRGCDATICNNYRAWEAAQIDFRSAARAQLNLVDQIQIETERSGEVTRIIQDGATKVSVLQVAQGIATAAVGDLQFGSDGIGASFPTSNIVAGAFDAGITQVEALTNIQLEQTESAATLGNLLNELALEQINKERAALAVQEARADYTAAIGDLVRFLRNYGTSQEALAEAYFSNPAYQVALERAAQNAESSFEAAMITAYKTTKALEYEWAERLSNPILDPSGLDRPIGDAEKFDDIVSAETAFAVRSAGDPTLPSPSLATFVEALQSWDSTMRELRGPLRQEGQTRTLLLKRDILGFDSPDEAFNRIAFRSHVASRRVPGLNPLQEDLVLEFPVQTFDQRLFPAVANLKIQSLGVDLRSVPGRELLSRPSPNPPLVDVIHDDEALIRTFFADFPGNDDFLAIQLEGARSFRQSQFFAQVESTIDGVGPASPNTQLARRSPAVSRWILRFEMDNGVNRDLLLENLDDVWIRVTYAFGQPEEFVFPDLLACPN